MKLIINADDFGLSKSVNQAIVDAFDAGNLTSATLMANMPGTAEAIALAKTRPRLGVGLHFTLTEGKALTGASSITDAGGNFMPRYTLIRRIYLGKVRAADIAQEFRAQLRSLYDRGIQITHSDSHQHLHLVPFIFKAIIPIIKEYNLPLRTVIPNMAKGLFWKRPVKYLKQRTLTRNHHRLISSYSFRHNDQMTSIHDLPVLPANESAFFDLIAPYKNTPDIVELVVHPYIEGADLHALYPGDYAAHEPFLKKAFLEHKLLTARPNIFSDYDLITYGDIR